MTQNTNLQKSTFTQTLIQAGLNLGQAQVYGALLKNGPLKASSIASRTTYKREMVYKFLEELVGFGLVVKNDQAGKVAIFEPGHPLKLKELAEAKEKQAKLAQMALDGQLPSLISEFNLSAGKPGVQFFEGSDGIWEVLKDSLQATEEIYSYADVESVLKYIKDINDKYVRARERLKIKKRILFIDSIFARTYFAPYDRSVTDLKFIRADSPPFESIMQIYDGKVSYITLSPEKMIGVIIQDPHIFTMHKYLFEFTWKAAIPLSGLDTVPDKQETTPPTPQQL